jgi:hypothetical protein
VAEFPLNVPARATVRGRIEEGALRGRHRPVDGAFAPARDAGEGILGRAARKAARAGGDSGPARREINASESG